MRDGRWGRAGETSGEDVFLTQQYMMAWTAGLQRQGSGDSRTSARDSDGGGGAAGSSLAQPLQALATCKHWSAYSLEGRIKADPQPYPARHQFDAVVSKQDLVEFYWPVFESCVKDAGEPQSDSHAVSVTAVAGDCTHNSTRLPISTHTCVALARMRRGSVLNRVDFIPTN